MKKTFTLIALTLLTFNFTGCVAGLMLNTKPDASIIIVGEEVDNSNKVEGSAIIYLTNLETKKEEKIRIFTFSTPDGITAIQNIDAGNYQFSKWEYNACRVMNIDKYGKKSGCKTYHDFKGTTEVLEKSQFTIKKGETLYLGNILLNSSNKTITLRSKKENDMKKLRTDLKGRTVKDISGELEIKDWEFKVTGRKIFGF